MKFSTGFLLFLGALWMLLALGCQTVTLASQDYRDVLLFALAGMVLADICCAVVIARGSRLRWVAIVIAIPSLFIVADFIRRAPYVSW